MTIEQIEALRKLLTWLGGFENSSLYKSYREQEGFTDDEYADVLQTLWDMVCGSGV